MEIHEHADPDGDSQVGRSEVMRFLCSRAAKHPALLGGIMALGIGAALAEGLTIALVFPLLQAISGDATQAASTNLSYLAPWFSGRSLGSQFRLIGGLLIALQGLQSGLRYAAEALSHRVRAHLERDLRMEVYGQISRLDLDYIQRQPAGRLFTLLNGFAGNAAQSTLILLQWVVAATLVALYLALLLVLSIPLTLLAAALAIIVSLFMGAVSRRARRAGAAVGRAAIDCNQKSFEVISSIRAVRQHGQEAHAERSYDGVIRRVQERIFRQGIIQGLSMPLFQFLAISILSILIISSTFVLEPGPAWAVTLLGFLVIMLRLLMPANQINVLRAQLAGNLPQVESLIDFLHDENKEFVKDGTAEFQGLKESIQLNNVSFRYSSAEDIVLDGLSMSFPKAKLTALVGASGAGKSTIVHLLMRLHTPTSGRLEADGAPLESFTLVSWRSKIGVVSQDIYLFNASVEENIRFARPSATREEIEAAARMAHAHEFIELLPQGYGTAIGERGVRLSGGQAQRVAIARAFLSDPEILILDEATSALDAQSERLIQAAVNQLSKNRTVIAVAHRLATVRKADKIIVVEKGRVVEEGTHEQLSKQGGQYASYVSLQDLAVLRAEPAPGNPGLPGKEGT